MGLEKVLFVGVLIAWGVGERALRAWQRRGSGAVRVQEYGTFVLIFGTAVVGGLAAVGVSHAMPGLDLRPRVAFRAVAIVLALLGGLLRIWAVRTLGRFFRATVHVQEGHEIVQSGPYRLIRHPAYSGLLLIFLGVGLWVVNAAGLVVYTIFVACGLLVRIRVEERVLIDQLGAAYSDYADRTARLIPGVW